MKKQFFALTFLLIACCCTNAQTVNHLFTFGISGGFNHTVINGHKTNGDSTGFIGSTIYGSLFAERKIGKHNFLSTGLTFSWLNYWSFLEVPFYYRAMVDKKLSIFSGPKLDIAADKFDKFKESTSKFVGLAYVAGARLEINRHFFAEATCALGISQNFNDIYFDINDGRRNDFRFGGGFHF